MWGTSNLVVVRPTALYVSSPAEPRGEFIFWIRRLQFGLCLSVGMSGCTGGRGFEIPGGVCMCVCVLRWEGGDDRVRDFSVHILFPS